MEKIQSLKDRKGSHDSQSSQTRRERERKIQQDKQKSNNRVSRLSSFLRSRSNKKDNRFKNQIEPESQKAKAVYQPMSKLKDINK